MTEFLFVGSKITVDSNCSHEIERRLLLGRKVTKNTLQPKVHIVKTVVFPIVMYGCESWTIRRLSAEKLMLSNTGAGEDPLETLGQQGSQTTQS